MEFVYKMKKLKYKIKYFLYSILCVFFNNKYDNKKNKYKLLYTYGTDLIQNNGKNNKFDEEIIRNKGIDLRINGNDNTILIGKDSKIQNNLRIIINGSNNKVDISDIIIGQFLNIMMAYEPFKTNNSLVKIGKKSRFVETKIMLLEDDSKCTIGEDCMFSEKVLIHLSDTHSILDIEGNLVNYGGDVEIGDHVWVGREARIMKKAKIASDTIVGANSICSSSYTQNHTVLAGNPAKIVKNGVTWTCFPPQIYKNQKMAEVIQ